MVVTGNEAIKKLEEAGFYRHRVTTGGHIIMKRGREKLMISPGGADLKDHALINRIEKLIEGDATSRDLQKLAHQGVELPQQILHEGDFVVHRHDSGRGYGVVSGVNHGEGKAVVHWPHHAGGALTSTLAVTDLRQQDPPRAGGTKPPSIPQKEEPLPEEEEAAPPRPVKQEGTLLDELAGLELAAEAEYDDLTTSFVGRVSAYEKVAALATELGIEVRPLPFRLVNGRAEEPAPEPPQTPPAAAERPVTTLADHTPRSELTTTPQPPEAEGIDGEVILLLSRHPEGLSTMALGQLFKGRTTEMRKAISFLHDNDILKQHRERHGKRDLTIYTLKKEEA